MKLLYRPPPVIDQLSVDSLGRLWVLIHLPQERWEDQEFVLIDTDGRTLEVPASLDGFDTVIEVVDPDARSVIASQRFDEVFHAIVNGRYLVTMRPAQDGRYIDLWRLLALTP